jgi:hypothetical protein
MALNGCFDLFATPGSDPFLSHDVCELIGSFLVLRSHSRNCLRRFDSIETDGHLLVILSHSYAPQNRPPIEAGPYVRCTVCKYAEQHTRYKEIAAEPRLANCPSYSDSVASLI